MCRAIPYQVLRVAGDHAQVLINGRPSWVSSQALPDLAPGEYVIVYANYAVERVEAGEAQALLQALADLDQMLGGGLNFEVDDDR
jgi:hydrogenase assembly chaperone HypC/HupF